MNQMAFELNERINTIMMQRNEFEGVLSSMVEGVMAVDMEEYILSMNEAAAFMFGCDPDEIRDRSIQVVIRNADLNHFVTKTLSSPAPVEKEIVLASNGEKFLNAHGTQLCDADGKQIGALIVLNDVTRLRKLEKIRKEFVANVSHEIKTPITAIKGFVETLRDGVVDDPAESQRFLAIIGKHVNRLEAVIEDLLKLSRIEQELEKREILLTEGNIKGVLLTAIQICEIKAKAKKIKIELSCDEQICSKIDSLLLEHAVVNLLVNAVKYSDEGSVMRVEALHTADEIIISVSDQGCGIEKKHLTRLFERFYRVDKARSREMGGTGLGLAIVKHIAQAHRGHVSVESALGKGSVFSIHLPG